MSRVELDLGKIEGQYFGKPGEHSQFYQDQTLSFIEEGDGIERTLVRLASDYLPPGDEFVGWLTKEKELAKRAVIVAAYFLNGGNRVGWYYPVEKGLPKVAAFLMGNIDSKLPSQLGVAEKVIAGMRENSDLLLSRYGGRDETLLTASDKFSQQFGVRLLPKRQKGFHTFVKVDLARLTERSIFEFAHAVSYSLSDYPRGHIPFPGEEEEPRLFQLLARSVYTEEQIRMMKREYKKTLKTSGDAKMQGTIALGPDGRLLGMLYHTIAVDLSKTE